jgi:hypothetical protein
MRGRILLLVAISGFLGAFVLPLGLIDRLIFQPSPGVDLTPEALGIEAESVFLESEDGVRIHAFFLPSPGATRSLLFLHGNAGNASHRLPNAADLAALGADVLLLDYRGYGLSEGRPDEAGVYADARAGLAHLRNDRSVPLERIVVFGRSLGGAVAVDLAADRPLAGLILESTFTSIADMARAAIGIPLGAVVGRRFPADQKIPRVRCPVLFFHGDRDRIVPFELGRRLYATAPEPKAFETIAGAGHNDTTLVGGAPYYQRIRRFLDEVAP